jgi:hypothetical protein
MPFLRHTLLVVFSIFALFSPETNACTAFLMKSGKNVLVANNEDGSNPETRMWTIPAGEKGRFGRICFGYDDLSAQGGVNEKGLWFDAFGLPYEPTYPVRGKIYPGDLQDLLLAECATVNDVVTMLQKYNRSQMTRYQWMFGDRNGNSIIVEADTIIRREGNFQVVTNFRNSKFPSGKGYECGRYQTATKLLGNCKEVNLQTMRKILSDTHSEGQDATQYSYIADLTNGLIYLYHFHNFENVVVFDLRKELAKGSQVYDIAALFPTTVAAETFAWWARKSLNDLKKSRFFSVFDVKTLPDYCGDYLILKPEVMLNQVISVTKGDSTLNLQLNRGGFYELVPDSPDSFSMLGYGGLDFKCRFNKVENQEKREIVLEGAGLSIVARRK